MGNLANISPEERREYDLELKMIRDRQAELDYARSEGFEKGERKGERKGIIKMIKGMLLKNIDIDTIAEISSLSPSAILKIRSQLAL